MGLPEIERAVDALLQERGSFSSGELAERTGLTRQALHRHLTRWVAQGRLVREGRARATRYRRPGPRVHATTHALAGLSEESVWRELRGWLDGSAADRSEAADQVLAYAVTELVNNAIDHSGAPSVTVRTAVDDHRVHVAVRDAGIGALESVRSRLGLEDHVHALQELSKGKVTTQPERHTGEGLFFVSKMVSRFELIANGLAWHVDNERDDQAILEAEPVPGTDVRIELPAQSSIPPGEVFARYTRDFEFDTTRCVVRLFEHGRRFVSRSEAKRLTSGLERFREVIVDFRGVEGVGQGFVDELFRVWARAHRGTRLVPRHMNEPVEFMVRRGLPAEGPGGEGVDEYRPLGG